MPRDARKGTMMRIRTWGLVICCAVLTACTAGPPKGPAATVTTPAVGRPPAPASVAAAMSSEVFTPYAPYAGLAGIHLEDQVAPKRCGHLEGKQVIASVEMASASPSKFNRILWRSEGAATESMSSNATL